MAGWGGGGAQAQATVDDTWGQDSGMHAVGCRSVIGRPKSGGRLSRLPVFVARPSAVVPGLSGAASCPPARRVQEKKVGTQEARRGTRRVRHLLEASLARAALTCVGTCWGTLIGHCGASARQDALGPVRWRWVS